MLDSVVIEGLKGVGKVELTFDPAHRVRVLFGVNGVGKTKTLEAMYLALLFSHGEVLNQKRHHYIKGAERAPAKAVYFDGQQFIGEFASGGPVQLVGEAAIPSAIHSRPLVYIGAGERSSVAVSPATAGILGGFAERRSRHIDRLIEEFADGRLRSAGAAGDIRAWFVQRAQSDNPFQMEKDNLRGEIDAVLHLLSVVDHRIDPDKMQIDGAQHVFLSIDGRMVELGELSSGFASIVKLFQAIIAGYSNFTNSKDLRNLPGVVLIDEIESHLHVSWQTIIIKRLKELFPNTEFIVATHSPLVLTQLEQGEAYLLQRDAGDGVVRSSVIDSPNMKAFADVLEATFGVDLNALKRDALVAEDQTDAKQALLEFIQKRRARNADGEAS